MIFEAIKAVCRTGIGVVLLISSAFASELRGSLDTALSSGNVEQILAIARDRKDGADQTEIFRWMREQVDRGQAPDHFAKIVMLASMARGNVEDALTYLNYYRALILIDSVTCRDPSSGGSLIEETIFFYGPLLDKKQTMSIEQKKTAVDRAVKLEDETAKVRPKDPTLCGAGLTAYSKALNVPLQDSGSPGHDSPDAKFSPKVLYIDDAFWRQKREEGNKLKNFLLLLNGVTSPK